MFYNRLNGKSRLGNPRPKGGDVLAAYESKQGIINIISQIEGRSRNEQTDKDI